jgi:hypothetical protein
MDVELLGDLIAELRDRHPRLPDDMDSGALAEAIIASSLFREALAEAWIEGWHAGFVDHNPDENPYRD